MSELTMKLGVPATHTLKDLVQDYERGILLTALELSGGNQRRVAASLGLLPSTLSEKLKRLGLRSPKSGLGLDSGSTADAAAEAGATP